MFAKPQGSSPAISEQSRFTSSYVPSTATRSPPYTAVVTTLPASRLLGMNTHELRPARAAAAATALARLPVEAHESVVSPNWRAADSAIATTRSLNEWVGLPLS